MFTEAAAVLEAGTTLWDHRNALASAFAKIANRVRHGNLKVIVFGSGGVGKTTLGRFLEGGGKADLGSTYHETLVTEKRDLPNNLYGSVLVTPGQLRRLTVRDEGLDKAIEDPDLALVINVVAYGYHSFENMSYREHKVFKEKGLTTAKEFIRSYSEERRNEEIHSLKHILSMLEHKASVAAPLRMITLVTKQDLWWNERAKVKAHYESAASKYLQAILAFERKKGEQHFQHEFLSASLMINNFRTTDQTVLAQNAAGYDEPLQYANLRHLSERLSALCTA